MYTPVEKLNRDYWEKVEAFEKLAVTFPNIEELHIEIGIYKFCPRIASLLQKMSKLHHLGIFFNHRGVNLCLQRTFPSPG